MYVSNRQQICQIRGSHIGVIEGSIFLGCYAVSKGKDLMSFRILFASCHGVTPQRQIFRHRDDKRLR